jgi:hypothetical protein
MNHERNLDVSEARFGLTLVICLLVVLGYVILHYLGGPRQAPIVEVLPSAGAEPSPAPTNIALPVPEEQPQVLTIEPSDDMPGHAQHTSPGDSELR